MKQLLILCVLLTATPAAAEIRFVENFDDDTRTWNWSSDKVTTSPSGERFLGPFGVETITVVVPIPEGTTKASVWFETLAIGDGWDEWVPGDYGPGPAYSSYSRSPLAGQGVVGLESNGLLGTRRRISVGNLGYPEGDRAYSDGWVWFAPDTMPIQDYYTFEFSGKAPGIQWGLDNFEVVAVNSIPEPSTIRMLILGMIAMAAAIWACRR